MRLNGRMQLASYLIIAVITCLGFGTCSAAPDPAKADVKIVKEHRDAARAALSIRDYRNAEHHLTQALLEADRIGKENQELIDILTDLANYYNFSQHPDRAEPLLRRTLRIREKLHSTNRVEIIEQLLPLARSCKLQRQYEEAAQLFQRAQKIIESKLGEFHPGVSLCLLSLGEVQESQKNGDQAEAYFLKALEVLDSKRSKSVPVPGPPPVYQGEWAKRIYSSKPVLLSAVLGALEHYYETNMRLTDAENVLERMVKEAELNAPTKPTLMLPALYRLVEVQEVQKRYSGAEINLNRVFAALGKTPTPDPFQVAVACHRMADVLVRQDKFVEADQYLKRLLALQFPGQPDRTTGSESVFCLSELAMYYARERNPREGEAVLNLAIQIKQHIWGVTDIAIAPFYHQLGQFYIAQGSLAKANATLEHSLALQNLASNRSMADFTDTMILMGWLKVQETKPAEAIKYYGQALALMEQVLGPYHPKLLPTLTNLVVVCTMANQTNQLVPLYERVIAIKEKQSGEANIEVADAVTKLGEFYVQQGKYSQAESYFARSLSIEEKARGTNNMTILPLLTKLSDLYVRLERDTELEAIYKRQILISEELFGAQNSVLIKPLEDYAAVLKRLKRDSDAEKVDARIKAIKGQ